MTCIQCNAMQCNAMQCNAMQCKNNTKTIQIKRYNLTQDSTVYI
jgi:hypothetical protein